MPIASRTHVAFAAPSSRFTAFRALLTVSLASGVQMRLSIRIASLRFALGSIGPVCVAMGHPLRRLSSLRSSSLADVMGTASLDPVPFGSPT